MLYGCIHDFLDWGSTFWRSGAGGLEGLLAGGGGGGYMGIITWDGFSWGMPNGSLDDALASFV